MNILDKISLLNNATLESLGELDRIKIIKRFTETGLKILGADYAFMFWKEDKRKKYKLAYKSSLTTFEPNLPREKGYNVKVEKSRTPYMGPVRVEKNPKYDLTSYMHSIAIVPILYHARRYGNLILCFKRKTNFPKEQRKLCVMLGNAMAQAITTNRLYVSLKDFKSTLDKTQDCIFMFDPETFKINYVNKGAIEQTDYSASQLYKKSFVDLQIGMAESKFRQIIEPLKMGKVENELYETVIQTKKSIRIPVEVSLQYVRADSNKADRFLSIVRDITERKRAEEAVKRSAYYDALTDVPNRALFSKHLHEAVEHAEHSDSMFALLFTDLDKFKFINDVLGHVAGDSLLYLVAQRLVTAVKKRDTVSRMGGDEFIILLEGIKNEAEAQAVAKRIQEIFSSPFNLDGQEIYVNISIGISIYPTHSRDIQVLLKNADVALHRVKEDGGANFQQYHSGIVGATSASLELEKELRVAIKKEQLVLYYQPQISFRTGKIVSAEALMRWKHPTLGLIYPNDFISRAEETGIIVQMGEWLFAEAVRQNKTWQDAGLPKIPIAVNLSPRQLLQQDLVEGLTKTLKDQKLDPKFLHLELTENVIMKNIELAVSVLEQCKKLGITCLIDDFGTGYASLNYLKRLPVEKIKIDQTFIHGTTTNSHDAAIVKAIISIAHQLNLEVVAEGVETKQQLEFLRDLDCDLFQGNFYSRAVPAIQFPHLLRNPVHLELNKRFLALGKFK